MKKTISVILCAALFLCVLAPVGSAYTSQSDWDAYYQNDADVDRAIMMQPGSNETQRNFPWLVPNSARDCYVSLSTKADMSGAAKYSANLYYTADDALLAAKATVTGLKPDAVYYYTCTSENAVSKVYSFRTAADGVMTAMYVSDIHITKDSASEHGRKWSNVLDQAVANAGRLDVVLSAGDQASNGSEKEYLALAANKAVKSVPFAPTIGNHDYGHDFYYDYMNAPNRQDGTVSQVDDYWFTVGEALFMVLDSNDNTGRHEAFIRAAIQKNPAASWRVVMMHHDLYSGVMSDREREAAELRPTFIPLFDKYDIDLVLLGHTHYYSMSHVLYDGEIEERVAPNGSVGNVNGTVYMVTNSINRTRNDSDPGYSDKIAFGYDPGAVVYNLISYTKDKLTVKSYDYEEDAAFNTFSISKLGGVRRGDVNTDGFFTAADARLALRIAVGLDTCRKIDPKFLASDFDCNGKVAAADARSILRMSVGLHP